MKFRAHKHLFRALGTIVSRKFGHSPISHKVRGNTAAGCEFGKVCHSKCGEKSSKFAITLRD